MTSQSFYENCLMRFCNVVACYEERNYLHGGFVIVLNSFMLLNLGHDLNCIVSVCLVALLFPWSHTVLQ